MNPRKALLLDLWAQLGLVVLVLVLLNILSVGTFARLDVTSDHIYTLSDTSRALMGSLQRPLFVKVYFTEDLEPPYNNHRQVLVDKLEEFRAYSRGLMDVSVVDPTGDPALEQEARGFGIRPIQYAYRGADRSELKRVFMGASFVYGERQAALDPVTSLDNLEYDIARTVRSLLSDEPPPLVGFSTGSGEVDLFKQGGIEEKLLERLREAHRVELVNLGGRDPVPDEVDALVVAGPQRQVSERAKYQVDQFLMKGGAVAFFVSSVVPDTRGLRLNEVFTGLDDLFASYGLRVNRDLVLDRERNGKMPFPVLQGGRTRRVLLNTPLIPAVRDLSRESPVTRDLEQMLFPFASSITVEEPLPRGVEATVLARASRDAARVRTLRTLDPRALMEPQPGEEKGPWPLAVALTGSFTSAFQDRPIPPPPAETPFGQAAVVPDDPASKVVEGSPTRLVVVGSHQVILNNVPFMLNLVDWMCQDMDLIGIRSRSVKVPAMDMPDPSVLPWLELANLLGPTLLLLLYGALRWALRRRASYRLEGR